ncbi:uncharacterized protein LOC124160824 [Ischnura elegans]|uniref:uncharacterized protein LOC124160824 n=1 Tax=Ischnura elegans TaxID=197161 RepID=UPI001ED8AEA9|nr:uncharacterized protein LOC124160824 [Ischnura elegans]
MIRRYLCLSLLTTRAGPYKRRPSVRDSPHSRLLQTEQLLSARSQPIQLNKTNHAFPHLLDGPVRHGSLRQRKGQGHGRLRPGAVPPIHQGSAQHHPQPPRPVLLLLLRLRITPGGPLPIRQGIRPRLQGLRPLQPVLSEETAPVEIFKQTSM